MKHTLADFKCGGPGHDGYAYCADTYCVGCGHAIIDELWEKGELKDLPDNDGMGTTDEVPQPIFFGDTDRSVHCARCGEYMYGTDPEPDWVDAHSVNCAACNELVDERECVPGPGNEGSVCPKCQEHSEE